MPTDDPRPLAESHTNVSIWWADSRNTRFPSVSTGPLDRFERDTIDRDIALQVWLIGLTDFGDAAVLLPLAAVLLGWLLLSRAPWAAAWWAAAIGVCAGLTASLKILFYGCPPASDLHSPSGHTSLSTLVYGAATLIIAVKAGERRAPLAIAAGTGLILAIALSRLLISAHSIPEIVIGLGIGGAALALFGRGYRRNRPAAARLAPLLVAGVLLLLLLHGNQLRAEALLHRLTGFFGIQCR
jgi:membrane-associated phospholipid phosphatase